MILFLDFDGVLHPYFPSKDLSDAENQYFSRTPLLWKILRACPKVKVVFSTTWRDVHSFEHLQNLVTKGGGEDFAHRFISSTPNLESGGHYGKRELEIQEWLRDNAYHGRWLAVDDVEEIFDGHPNLYLVDGDRGLTDEDVLAIIERAK